MIFDDQTIKNEVPIDVLRRFAPKVYLHSSEDNAPSSVEWYISQVEMYSDVDGAIRRGVGQVNPKKIWEGIDQTNPYYLRPHVRGPSPSWNAIAAGVKPSESTTVPCYVHVRRGTKRAVYALTYHFFYPCNGLAGAGQTGGYHEGDWESVTVWIWRDGGVWRALRMYASQHGDGEYMPLIGLEGRLGLTSEAPLPVVYAGLHSHAVYYSSGEHRRLALDMGTDYCNEGLLWDCSKSLVVVNAEMADPGSWVHFHGLWGSPTNNYGFFPGGGPKGPRFGDLAALPWFGGEIIPRDRSGDESPRCYGSGPAAARIGGTMYVVHRGNDGELWWFKGDKDSYRTAFTEGTRVREFESADRVALVEYGGYLQLIHRGQRDNKLWYCTSDGGGWSDVSHILNNSTSLSGPAAAVYNGIMYVVHRSGSSNRMFWLKFDGTNWHDLGEIGGHSTIASPSIVAFQGNLWMFYRGADNQNLYYGVYDGRNWTVPKVLQTQYGAAMLEDGPTATVYRGKLVVFHRGHTANTQDIYFCVTADGQTWEENRIKNHLSDHSPAVVNFDDERLYVLYKAHKSPTMWFCLDLFNSEHREVLHGARVALRSAHGTYLSAQPNDTVVANRSEVAEWETFTIEYGSGPLRDGTRFALRSYHGKYLSALADSSLRADTNVLGDWQRFTCGGPVLRYIEGGGMSLRTYWNKYVVAEDGPGGVVRANRDSVGPSETWQMLLL